MREEDQGGADLNKLLWQKIQDNFSSVTGISIRTVDPEGQPLTRPSLEPRLCTEIIKDKVIQDKFCGLCLPTFLGGNQLVDKNLSYACLPGLYNFITPLRGSKESGSVLGYIIMGPVILVMRSKKEDYQKVSDELNVSLDDFWRALLEIKVTSFSGIQSIINLIRDIGNYIIDLALEKQEGRKQPSITWDPLKLSRLLDLVLDVAFEISGADIGSIMLLDEERKNLFMRSWRGIADEIAKNAQVRVGEGISGIAAKEGRAFLINESSREECLTPYLKRPYLGSSMIMPLKIKDDLVGVMNLGTLKTSPVSLNEDKLETMNKLVDLATMTVTASRQ